MSYFLGQMFADTGWVFWTLVSVAGVSLVSFRHTAHTLLRISFITTLSTLAAWLYFRNPPATGTPIQSAAWLCAALSFSWSVSAAVVISLISGQDRSLINKDGFVPLSHIVALLFGVASVICHGVVLCMRLIDVAVDLVRGFPGQGIADYGFGVDGLWSMGLLLGSGFIAFLVTGDRRLVSCQWWLALMMATWACLLQPLYSIAPTGRYERTSLTVLMVVLWSLLFAISVFFTGRMETSQRWSSSHTRLGGRVDPSKRLPGYRLSCSILTVAMAILICYHYLVPIVSTRGGLRTTLLIISASALLSGFSSFILATRSWNGYLADAAFGLTSLSICGVAMLVLPSRPVSLDVHYPMIFTAMIFGLTVAGGLCTWLTTIPRERFSEHAGTTVTNRIISTAKRFAFFNLVLALLASSIMAIWPRLTTISTSDDSFGRMIAGLGADLVLLLVMLWTARRLRRLTLHILTALAVVSTGGFLLIRMIPFSSQGSL